MSAGMGTERVKQTRFPQRLLYVTAKNFYTIEQIAHLLGMTEEVVYRMVNQAEPSGICIEETILPSRHRYRVKFF